MGHGEVNKDYKEEIMKMLENIENIDTLESYIEHITQTIQKIQPAKREQYNELGSTLTTNFLVLYNKIEQQYSNKPEKEKNKLIDDIENILTRDGNLGPVVALRIREARKALPLHQKITQAFQDTAGQIDSTHLENNIAALSLKIMDTKNSTPGKNADPFTEALQKESKSFFMNFDDDKIVGKFVEKLKNIPQCSSRSFATIQEVAGQRISEIHEMRIQERKEQEQSLSFKKDGALAAYLESADAKTLATNLDRNMRNNNIGVDDLFEIDHKIQVLFPESALAKMQEVGKELQRRQEGRSTFVGKVKQKAEDYVAIVINAFSKLTGKKVDDPKLDAAMKEYASKIQDIEKHLATETEKDQKGAKQLGKFVDQVLVSQQEKIATPKIRK